MTVGECMTYDEIKADVEAGGDWREVFSFANIVSAAVSGSAVSCTPFTFADVVTINGAARGENDGAPWIAYGRLVDGRAFFISAGCDYTGWDCQASGGARVADVLAVIKQFGMGDEDRHRLGVVL